MKARFKMHQMPGDIPKRQKAAMLEGRWGGKRARTFKRMFLMRERAVLTRRARLDIERAER